jgi:Lon-like ATP-dependent protease
LVKELGEETFPEPKEPELEAAAAAASTSTSTSVPTAPEESSTQSSDKKSSTTTSTATTTESIPSEELPPNIPPPPSSTQEKVKPITTHLRSPMPIPPSVHVRITPSNLKDYVGPPVYQKDRMYVHPPPPGVSTGLGYLGNGSGAVMPVEAMVRFSSIPSFLHQEK